MIHLRVLAALLFCSSISAQDGARVTNDILEPQEKSPGLASEAQLAEELRDFRIVGGRPATFNNTQHQVSLRVKKWDEEYGFGYGHRCGGSLIAPNVVLTAAHCVFPEKSTIPFRSGELIVVMGLLNVFKKTPDTQVISVKKIIPHHRYNFPNQFANDIAVLILANSVPINHAVIKSVPLTVREAAVGTQCIISGWGALIWEGDGAPQLQIANVKVENVTRCNSTESYDGFVAPGVVCAGNYDQGGVDSCQGDSGGPLVCNGVLVGVTSWGDGCAKPKFPGLYSDVYYFRDWIETNSNSAFKVASAPLVLLLASVFISFYQ